MASGRGMTPVGSFRTQLLSPVPYAETSTDAISRRILSRFQSGRQGGQHPSPKLFQQRRNFRDYFIDNEFRNILDESRSARRKIERAYLFGLNDFTSDRLGRIPLFVPLAFRFHLVALRNQFRERGARLLARVEHQPSSFQRQPHLCLGYATNLLQQQ